ncbi:DNA adenine methylase [Xanthomonas oryzae pv. oryzicola]|uniref:DNA adenine methylase n=1 Tax=Xanthomonas oryzae TaxID=347 RepID=UPI00313331CF
MSEGKDGNFYSPLRYPGGKGRMGPWLARLMRENGLEGGCYVEPYAGGAGAALYLLLRGHAKRIVINDADPAIHAFWETLVDRPDELIRLIWAHAPTMETRGWSQQVLRDLANHTTAEVGFAAFFLNRTSRSGILNGGVIGGKEQAGPYKLDARYNRQRLVSRIEAVAAYSDRIQVHGLDALKLFSKIRSKLPKKTLIYMDPPYYVKGSQLYRNCYGHDDHALVAQAAKRLEQPLVITYDDTSEIRKIYKGMKSTLFSLTYSTHLARPLASEVLFYNNLTLPMPPTLTRRMALSECA